MFAVTMGCAFLLHIHQNRLDKTQRAGCPDCPPGTVKMALSKCPGWAINRCDAPKLVFCTAGI
eukprot:UN17160